MFQHYLAKEETQKTVHWCFVHATQSNCCSALDFLSPEPCPQKPQAEGTDYKIYGVIQQPEYESRVKKIEEIKQTGSINTVSEKCNFYVSRFPR